MSSPPWLLRLAGRHLLPLLLFVFALLTISLRYQHQMGAIAADVVQQESERLRERLSIDQSQLDQRMGLDDTLVLRRLVDESGEGLFAAVATERPLLAYYANAVAHLR